MQGRKNSRVRRTKMLQTASSYLLTTVLLICPYLCLGEAACANSTSHHECDCSCAKHQDRSGEVPLLPSDLHGSDCLCHGAIMDCARGTEHAFAATPTIHWLVDGWLADGWLAEGVSLSSIELYLAGLSIEPPCHFPPLSSGWDICVLTCSLLF